MAGTAAKIYKAGTRVVCIKSDHGLFGDVGTVQGYSPEHLHSVLWERTSSTGTGWEAATEIAPLDQQQGPNMLQDIRTYVKENRQVLYTVAFIVALDHFVFNGAFRERLKGLVDGMLKKVEEKTK